MSEARRQRWFWARIKLSLISVSFFNVRNSSDVSVKTEVLTDVVRLYELTHGPTYLVFKYQLFTSTSPSRRNSWLYRSRTCCQATQAKFSKFSTEVRICLKAISYSLRARLECQVQYITWRSKCGSKSNCWFRVTKNSFFAAHLAVVAFPAISLRWNWIQQKLPVFSTCSRRRLDKMIKVDSQ